MVVSLARLCYWPKRDRFKKIPGDGRSMTWRSWLWAAEASEVMLRKTAILHPPFVLLRAT
jgi:hypothetical protein